ncbi:hypothetical protein EYZ11_012666 [Aspergillus tanneri]|uniref:Histone deacetylase complex subunit SAP30 Sin3 binding domain-containing protein n=1 Tax=Aspergillus tanneri TaxID=1220188 RepID=A0A4S3J1T0_9EURO|nr:uncharacterized protein ATNIH1004_003392 [Aspergillus tanneri]KAA8650704.1 hypothetical protein ATNIH1004_003392 [Aspergillus tanneri]THC87888.1 hypothetical protein EYZ11_012666 [Aspergillus tanneri]
MAPPRQRTTAVQDDSRSEGSSTTREHKTTTAKGRKGNTSLASTSVSSREAKHLPNITSAPAGDEPDTQPKLHWTEMPLEMLHSYRHAYKLPCPSAFNSEYSRLLLSKGIGLRSPTSIAAQRAHLSQSDKDPKPNGSNSTKKTLHTSTDRRNGTAAKYSSSQQNRHAIDEKTALNNICSQDRVSKNQLALAVRKHFSSAGLAEQEAIARFLYKVREEGRGRHFRLRFQP